MPAKERGKQAAPRRGEQAAREKELKKYPIGYFHVDITTIHTAQGRLYLFVGIDRSCKYVYLELHPKMTRSIAANFLRDLIQALPYQVPLDYQGITISRK